MMAPVPASSNQRARLLPRRILCAVLSFSLSVGLVGLDAHRGGQVAWADPPPPLTAAVDRTAAGGAPVPPVGSGGLVTRAATGLDSAAVAAPLPTLPARSQFYYPLDGSTTGAETAGGEAAGAANAGARTFGNFAVNDLRAAAQVADRNGLTQVGRALQKHSGREGSVFNGLSSGSATARNEQGLRVLDDILNDPAGRTQVLDRVTNIWDLTGRGVRYGNDGSFMGFLGPVG